MSDADLNLGAMVLLAADYWRAAPWHERLAVWLLGRRERFSHLGARLTVAWWQGRPYLVSIREAR